MSNADKIRKTADALGKQAEAPVPESRVVLLRPAIKKIDAACIRAEGPRRG